MQTEIATDKILKLADVVERYGISKFTLLRWEIEGRMPPRRQFSPRFTGWLTSEIEAWIKTRPRVGQGALN